MSLPTLIENRRSESETQPLLAQDSSQDDDSDAAETLVSQETLPAVQAASSMAQEPNEPTTELSPTPSHYESARETPLVPSDTLACGQYAETDEQESPSLSTGCLFDDPPSTAVVDEMDAFDFDNTPTIGTDPKFFAPMVVPTPEMIDAQLENEADDCITQLAPPVTGKKRKRLSALSVASSIASLAPLILGAGDEREAGAPRRRSWFRAANNRSQCMSMLMDHAANNARTAPRNRGSITNQTINDWTATLETSFDSCLGNSNRFQLNVPQIETFETPPAGKSSSKWARMSRMLFPSAKSTWGPVQARTPSESTSLLELASEQSDFSKSSSTCIAQSHAAPLPAVQSVAASTAVPTLTGSDDAPTAESSVQTRRSLFPRPKAKKSRAGRWWRLFTRTSKT